MKGFMGLLEAARLVRQVDGEDDGEPGAAPAQTASPGLPVEPAAPVAPVEQTSALGLEQVYADAGIAACAYPAERLMRLMDGLKAMDEPTRLQTIRAIDAADDSWTIDDPIGDANAKLAAIDAHVRTIRAGVAQAEHAAQSLLADMQHRQEGSMAEIRRQIDDLQALLSREVARGAQEAATVEAGLQAKKDGAARELDKLARVTGDLQALVGHFSNENTTRQG